MESEFGKQEIITGRMWENNHLCRRKKLSHNLALGAGALSCRRRKYLSLVKGGVSCKVPSTFPKQNAPVLPFGTSNCINGPCCQIKLTCNTFLTVCCLLAILGRTAFLVTYTLLEHLCFGSK